MNNSIADECENIVMWPNEFTLMLLIDTGESSSLRYVLYLIVYYYYML